MSNILSDAREGKELNILESAREKARPNILQASWQSLLNATIKDDWAPAPGETVATMVTGIAGSIPAGFAGLASEFANISRKHGYLSPAQEINSGQVVEDVAGALTYGVGYGREPSAEGNRMTPEGEAVLGVVSAPFNAWSEHVAKRGGEAAQDLGAAPSVAAGIETALEFAPWILMPWAYRKGRYGGPKDKAFAEISAASELQAMEANAKKTAVASAVEEAYTPAALENVKSVVAPIGTGSPRAQAIVKNYTNKNAQIDTLLRDDFNEAAKRFPREDISKMGEAAAADEAALARGEPPTAIDSLPLDQKNYVRAAQSVLEGAATEAKAVGVLPPGPSIEGYFPRVIIRELGPAFGERVAGGKSVKTSTSRSKKRKYETIEETEAAAKAKIGEDVSVSRDIRQYYLVAAELQRAINGKKLINEIRRTGNDSGVELVRRKTDAKPDEGFFTLENNAAFWEYRPQTKPRPEGDVGPRGGKKKVRKDEEGEVVFEKRPLQIAKEFEGPLRAALEGTPNRAYRAIMQIKSAAMQAIMISPMMHGMVIWGKAFPYMPIRGLTFKNYRDGFRIENVVKDPLKKAKNDEWVRDMSGGDFATSRALKAESTRLGLRPIGDAGWMQRMSDTIQTPSVLAGKSMVSRMVGRGLKPLGETVSTGTMRGIDAFGHFWHDTLLWTPIRASGYGMWLNIRQSLIKKGTPKELAGTAAAHLSNRFMGSIPFEDLSAGTRAAMNAMLFSKSFTGTNLGLYVDAVRGLPRAVQSQLLHNMKALDMKSPGAKAANSAVRQAAGSALMKDILMMYFINSMAQSAIRTWQDSIDVDLGNIFNDEKFADVDKEAFAAAYQDEIQLHKDAAERWWTENDTMFAKVQHYDELSPLHLNDPGKEQRVRYGTTDEGTAQYLRIPVGKVGEDLEKAFKAPLELAMNKLSPTVGFVMDMILNDKSGEKGYGIEVYNADENILKIMGQTAMYFFESHTAFDAIERAKEAFIEGDMTAGKELMAQLTVGASFSKGAPGGPLFGAAYEIDDKKQRAFRRVGREARKLIEQGLYGEAADLLVSEGELSGDAAANYIMKRVAPQTKLTKKFFDDLLIHADAKETAEILAIIEKEFGTQ